jgi:biofilm PGA synthesis N-glycosyltransferase PgaC
VFRASAARPIPPLRPVADFVALPDGARPVPPESRFALAASVAAGWAGVVTLLLMVLGVGVAGRVTWPYALVLTLAAVSVPAGRAAFRLLGLQLDDPDPVQRVHSTTAVSILVPIAAPDATMAALAALAAQDYLGPSRVLLLDTGTGEQRAGAASAAARQLHLDFELLHVDPVGPHDPRSVAAARAATPLVLTLAPGAVLHPSALRLLVARLESSPADTVAVTGHALARTTIAGPSAEGGAAGWVVERDAVRRVEGLFAGPLACDPACTLVHLGALQAVNGWPGGDASDVTLTWRLLERGWRVAREPLAIAFTTEPVTFAAPARAQLAGARAVRAAAHDSGGTGRLPQHSSRLLAFLDRRAPLLDLGFTLAAAQALVLVGLGLPSLVLGYVALVLPLQLGADALERRRHREVLDEAGLVLVAPRLAGVVALPAVQAPLCAWLWIRHAPTRPLRVR